jgi:hypothetical protein
MSGNYTNHQIGYRGRKPSAGPTGKLKGGPLAPGKPSGSTNKLVPETTPKGVGGSRKGR